MAKWAELFIIKMIPFLPFPIWMRTLNCIWVNWFDNRMTSFMIMFFWAFTKRFFRFQWASYITFHFVGCFCNSKFTSINLFETKIQFEVHSTKASMWHNLWFKQYNYLITSTPKEVIWTIHEFTCVFRRLFVITLLSCNGY